MTFEFNPDYVNVVPKFIGFEDPYLLIHEFEEVCSLIHMPRASINVVSMKFLLFALEHDFKRWMYVLKVVFVNSWDFLADIHLKRHVPTNKTIRL